MNSAPHILFFVGIGGIGMSGLARYFKAQGAVVAGYDRTASVITSALQEEGIAVQFDEAVENMPAEFRSAANVLVVRTPAVPADSALLRYWEQRGAQVIKRAELLGMVTRDLPTVAVAGTHGKTTVSSMLAHLLLQGGVPVNAFLGGIAANYGTNMLLDKHARMNVVEADEFDRSFLHLEPSEAIITSMDADHLDVYANTANMVEGYRLFAEKCTGGLIVNGRIAQHFADKEFITYGLSNGDDLRASNINVRDGKYHFDLVMEGALWQDLTLGMPGRHNVENAVAACYVASRSGVDEAGIRAGVASFQGVHRRFRIHINTPSVVFIDDYAHHPAELEATILSAREMYPGRKLTGVFQPHLFSRTRDLADGFAQSLALLDELILLEIYPAREEPIPGVTSQALLARIDMQHKQQCVLGKLPEVIQQRKIDVLLTLGAGSIDTVIDELTSILEQRI